MPFVMEKIRVVRQEFGKTTVMDDHTRVIDRELLPMRAEGEALHIFGFRKVL